MSRKALLIAATVIATAASGAMLTQVAATRTARAEVTRLLARTQGLTIGGLDVDALAGRVVLRDVAMTSGSTHVYARTLDLPLRGLDFGLVSTASAATADDHAIRLAQWRGTESPTPSETPNAGIELKIPGQAKPPAASAPAAPPPAAASTATAGTASASDVTIVDNATTFVIKKIDLTGTTLTNADLATLLDSKSPDSIETRLRKFTATSVVISQITASEKDPDSSNAASVSTIVLSDVVQGRIGTATAAGSRLSSTGGEDAVTLKSGAIEAKGLDLALITHLLDATRTDDADPLKTLSESLTINDFALTNAKNKATMTIAKIAQRDLKARPLRTSLKAMKDASKTEPGGDDTTKTRTSKAIADDILSSYEVGAFTLDTFAFSSVEKEGPVKIAIGSIGLQDFRKRTLALFTIRDFAVEAPSAKVSMATVDFSNIVIPPLSKTPDPATALTTDAVPSIAKADIGQLAIDVEQTDDSGATKVKFKLAHVGSSSDQTYGHLPSQGVVTLDNLTFDIPPGDNPGARELIAMGYKHLDLSSVIATAYDQKAETLSIQKFLVSGVGMGSVNLAIDIDNVNKGVLSANSAVAKASALAMLLKRVDIKVANNGLMEKALDWKAKQDGRTVAAERDLGIDLFAVKVPEMLGNGVGIKAIGAAVARFIADPKTLHVSVASKDGLGVSDMGALGAPDELLNRLDIKAEANQ